MCLVNTARALDPNRAVSQYIRARWDAGQGFPGGAVYAIAQTVDGYLWIGAEKGLVRFDGLNFRLFNHANSPTFPNSPVLGLIADAEGHLWVRLQNLSLLRYHGGTFQNVLPDLSPEAQGVTAMCQGKNGEVLFVDRSKGVLRHGGEKLATLAFTAGRPNFLVISMAETADGKVWLGTRDRGLFSLSGGIVSSVVPDLPDRKINCLLPIGAHELWFGTDNGVVRWNGNELTRAGLPRSLEPAQTLAMARDREANIWIGTAGGLFRINAQGVSSWERRSGESVTALFEDREGNLWVGSTRGIERFRDSVFMTYPASRGLGSDGNGPLYADDEGRAWFAPSNGGLFWLEGAQIERVGVAGLGKDVVYSIAGGKGELWVGRQRGGLTRLRYKSGSFRAETFTQAEGLAQNSVYAVHQSRDGTVWAGTLSGGVSSFKNGKFTTYTTANGLASNTVTAIWETSDGTMWIATPNGLNALSEGRWRTYTGRDGLPPGNVNCLLEDSTGALWIGTSKGLAFLKSGQIELPREAPESLREAIFGLAEDRNGWLWIATSSQVVRVPRDKLLRGSLGDGDVREYGPADGLAGTEGVKRSRSVVADPLGRIWFSLNRGISVVDPALLSDSSAPAIAHIQSISADGSSLDPQATIRVPAATQRVTFSYAGLSLSAPDRVRYRYRLDGVDRDWSEPVTTREAIYSNLGPGPYRFRVIASNSEGFWNGAEATLRFEIEPLFWQTWWARLAGALFFVFAILAVYRLRLRQLTRQMNVRFEERLAERTRIAQELHDTLLQGFLSASMQLHVAVDQVPDDLPAKPRLGRVLQLMGQVIEEGRNALRGLRSANSDSLDLEQAFSRVRQELAVHEQVGFRVTVVGRPRGLHPVLRDEVYRIGREALVNAFRHSRAKSIEVEVEYAADHLRVLVRDDGCGIDPQVVRAGRDGHFGLTSMRERAERIGARLTVRSHAASGTEVELSVPGRTAFESQHAGRLPQWFAGLSERRVEQGLRGKGGKK
jgi:signal transduction histidine kinase/ligand-binding sensor domain-containing protein